MGDITFCADIKPDWEALVNCIQLKGTPDRVHFIELFLDQEIQTAICDRFGLADDLNPGDPFYGQRRQIAIQRFLGYDYIRCGVEGVDIALNRQATQDTAGLQRSSGRSYVDEHIGPITNWEELEKYPWPDLERLTTRSLEWYNENLPDDMCIIGSGGYAHFFEWLSWLMGYETLCFALYDQRNLISAIIQRILDINIAASKLMLQFDRVKIIWASDDLGYRSGTLISPSDLREFVLPAHKLLAGMAHENSRPYLLHSCGKLTAIMDDLIDDVGIDGKHSFEDTIEDVADVKETYGRKIALLGGIDVDFLCRASKEQVRNRVRNTLDKCMLGGGYCLGTGNSVANYIPVENYFAMLDEGRRFSS